MVQGPIDGDGCPKSSKSLPFTDSAVCLVCGTRSGLGMSVGIIIHLWGPKGLLRAYGVSVACTRDPCAPTAMCGNPKNDGILKNPEIVRPAEPILQVSGVAGSKF